jgi:hypothetical protein
LHVVLIDRGGRQFGNSERVEFHANFSAGGIEPGTSFEVGWKTVLLLIVSTGADDEPRLIESA